MSDTFIFLINLFIYDCEVTYKKFIDMVNVVIIQTRMTSTRLPGKVMLPLGDKTVLGEVLSRCNKIKGIGIGDYLLWAVAYRMVLGFQNDRCFIAHGLMASVHPV